VKNGQLRQYGWGDSLFSKYTLPSSSLPFFPSLLPIPIELLPMFLQRFSPDYGAFPQTWEDPAHVTEETGCCGDNDPLDVFDIGNRRWAVGAIVRVKVLGVIGLIDAGETDWKVVAISAEDPLAPLLNDLDDIEVQIPGALESLISWLRFYKSPVINAFAFDGRPQGRAYAERIIEETHVAWKGASTQNKHTTHNPPFLSPNPPPS
jgi:inorganic pyrophosphatase